MKDRLTQFLQLEQLSPARFADILGVQRSGVSHILSGRNKPGFDLIEKILTKFPEINAEWLITGKGKMYKETESPLLFSQQESNFQSITKNIPISNIIPENQSKLHGKTIDESRCISKIIILYSDKSFSEYHPE